MDRSKITIVGLVCLACLFATGSVIGISQPDNDKPTSEDIKAGRYSLPDWTQAMNSVFAPFRPKVELKKKSFTIARGRSLDIQVPASEQDEFRTAEFELMLGKSAKIVYKDQTKDIEKDFQEQVLNFESSKKTGQLLIHRDGGKITITCKQSCEISLK